MRYGLYYAPGTESAWWEAGCRWLGYDAATLSKLAQVAVPGISPVLLNKICTTAQRYGFHATLKAPFRLAEGFNEQHLLDMAQAFCEVQTPIQIPQLAVRPLGDFLALRPTRESAELAELAMRCVSFFDLLRAPPSEHELIKRRRAGLSLRQEDLLQKWGYPYTEDEFRFHLTLTDSLADMDEDVVYAVRRAAEQCFEAVVEGHPLTLDRIVIFRESQDGAPFEYWRSLPFAGEVRTDKQPPRGRVFACVGGRDSGVAQLITWAQLRLADNPHIHFPVTCTTDPDSSHRTHTDVLEHANFWRQAAGGLFTLVWESHGNCYGVRRGMEAELKAGRDAVLAITQESLPRLQSMFPDTCTIWIERGAETRMSGQVRENGAALLHKRRGTVDPALSERPHVIRIPDSNNLDVAGRRLLEILSDR